MGSELSHSRWRGDGPRINEENEGKRGRERREMVLKMVLLKMERDEREGGSEG